MRKRDRAIRKAKRMLHAAILIGGLLIETMRHIASADDLG